MIKGKGDKLYFKWEGYNSLFNSWIDKKDLVYRIRFSILSYKNESIFSKTL